MRRRGRNYGVSERTQFGVVVVAGPAVHFAAELLALVAGGAGGRRMIGRGPSCRAGRAGRTLCVSVCVSVGAVVGSPRQESTGERRMARRRRRRKRVVGTFSRRAAESELCLGGDDHDIRQAPALNLIGALTCVVQLCDVVEREAHVTGAYWFGSDSGGGRSRERFNEMLASPANSGRLACAGNEHPQEAGERGAH